MRLSNILVLGGMLGAAVATDCNRDNCLRAVVASAFPTRSGAADCASYFKVTVGPTSTVTPTAIPAYASACSGSVRYSSACSCVGATHVTTTLPTPSCKAGVCGTFVITYDVSCGPLGDCTCGKDADGNGVCVQDLNCAGAQQCTTNAECGAGKVCWTESCCNVGICAVTATVCPNTSSTKMMFRGRAVMKRNCVSAAKCT